MIIKVHTAILASGQAMPILASQVAQDDFPISIVGDLLSKRLGPVKMASRCLQVTVQRQGPGFRFLSIGTVECQQFLGLSCS
jgi:hypothetical protein